MKTYDYTKIDFPSIEVQRTPKQLQKITDLYRACKFEEAEILLDKAGLQTHQTADIMAQLTFFQWNFDKAVEYILEYYAWLGEWYSGNKKGYTEKMLAFSLLKATPKVREEAIEVLQHMYDSFTEEQLKDFKHYRQFAAIPRIIDIANGNAENYYHTYKPCESPKEFSEVLNDYAKYHDSQLKALRCSPEEDAFTVRDLLILIEDRGKTDDFIRLYEKHCQSSKLSESNHMVAIKIYMYLKEYERAKNAVVNCIKYTWYPIEYTDVMPLSIFYDYSFMELFTKELFEEIFHIPKGVDIETKLQSESLISNKNFDVIFHSPHENTISKAASSSQMNSVTEPISSLNELENKAALNTASGVVLDISKLSIPSGKLVAADLVFGLTKETYPYYAKIPKGEYHVQSLFINKKIAMMKVNFTDVPAVKYINAIVGNESQAEIDELEKGTYFGFEIESGIVTIVDDKVKREFFKYLNKWKKKNKKGDFYADCIEIKLEEASKIFPEFQSEKGSYIDFVIPDTEYHMPVFRIEDKIENCPVFMGYDSKGKVCSMVIEFINKFQY